MVLPPAFAAAIHPRRCRAVRTLSGHHGRARRRDLRRRHEGHRRRHVHPGAEPRLRRRHHAQLRARLRQGDRPRRHRVRAGRRRRGRPRSSPARRPARSIIAGRFNSVNGVDPAQGGAAERRQRFAGHDVHAARRSTAWSTTSRWWAAGCWSAASSPPPARPTRAAASPRSNATTGALDTYLTVEAHRAPQLDRAPAGAKAPVGADKLAVSPDGTQLVVDRQLQERQRRAARPGGQARPRRRPRRPSPTGTPTGTTRAARWQAFDSWVRDVAFSPGRRYFVIVHHRRADPRHAVRHAPPAWEANATGTRRSRPGSTTPAATRCCPWRSARRRSTSAATSAG